MANNITESPSHCVNVAGFGIFWFQTSLDGLMALSLLHAIFSGVSIYLWKQHFWVPRRNTLKVGTTGRRHGEDVKVIYPGEARFSKSPSTLLGLLPTNARPLPRPGVFDSLAPKRPSDKNPLEKIWKCDRRASAENIRPNEVETAIIPRDCLEMNPLQNKDKAPVAFLSSLSDGLEDLREKLHADCNGELWVAEKNEPHLDERHPLEIVDTCVDALKQSEIFICVLGGSERAMTAGGTAIELGGIQSLVSYFEIEIFQAALSQIPIVFLERTGFSPGLPMAEFLVVLKRSSIVTLWATGFSNSETLPIRNAVKAAIRDREKLRNKAVRQLQRAVSDLATRLVATRGRLRNVQAGGSDMLWMQGDRISPGRPPADDQATLNRATKLLRIAGEEKRHDRKLSRLYFVFRELMANFYLDTSAPEPLALWNSAFGLWCGSASWYGLHNHLAVGVIGGLWSQHLVRERLRRHGRSNLLNSDLRPPFGGLASAYLSLAKLCNNPWLRWQVCRAGIKLATDVIEASADEDIGIFAVRGSLFFAEFRPFRGMKDFQRLLLLAEKQPERLELNAEAHTYAGRGYTLTRRLDKAGEHLREAVKLWEHIVETKQSGEEFLVKAMKHLLDYQIRVGKLDEAAATASKALHLARTKGISDQARQIEQIVAKANLNISAERNNSGN